MLPPGLAPTNASATNANKPAVQSAESSANGAPDQARPAVAKPTPDPGSEQAWARARANITVKAVMTRSGRTMILANNQILGVDDTHTVRYAGHDDPFTVKAIHAGRPTADFEPFKSTP